MSSKRLLINTGSNIFVTVLKMIIALIMTPILVRNLGNHDYGIWEIIVSVIGYMGLLDLGLRPSVTRFIAYYQRQGLRQRVQDVFATSLAFMLMLGSLSLIGFIAWAELNPAALSETGDNLQRYRWLLLIVGANLFFYFPGAVAESTLDGFHKFYLKNTVTVINTVIGNALIFLLIQPDNAVLVVAGISALGLSVKYVIYFIILYRHADVRLSPNPLLANWATYRELIGFGVKSFIQGVCWRIQNSMDPLLIAWVINPASIIYYAIPANLITYFRTLAMNLTQALLPVFSEWATDKTHDSRPAYLRISRYILFLLLPIAMAIFVVGDDFIRLWIGVEVQQGASGILSLLLVVAVLTYLDPICSKYLTAENLHGIYARLTPIGVVINAISTVIALHQFGVIGAAIGTLIPTLIFIPVFFIYRGRHQGLSPWRYVQAVLLPLLVPVAALGLLLWQLKQYWPIDNFLSLFAELAVAGIVYLLLALVFTLNGEERAQLMTQIGKVASRLRRSRV